MSFETYIAAQAGAWSDELTATVKASLEQARRAQAEEAEANARRAAAAAAELATQRDALYDFLAEALPEDLCYNLPGLLPAIRAQVDAMDRHDLQRYALTFTYTAPGLAPLGVEVYSRVEADQVHYALSNLFVRAPRRLADDCEPDWDGITYITDSPAQAIYRAALNAWRMTEYQQEWANHLAEQAEQEAANAMQYHATEAQGAALAARNEAQRLTQEIEIERLIAWARSDPAVLHLIRAFIAIEQERIEIKRRLDVASEEANDAWTYYESRRAELEQRSATARADAERYEREARAAQDEADQLRRQVKETGR